jgi:hypothetical protein
MSMTKGTSPASQIVWLEQRVKELEDEIEMGKADVLLRQARLCIDPFENPDMAEEIDDYLKGDKHERELAELQNAFEDAMTAREQAESRAAALEEALSQMLDDMGADGFCVCPAAKEQAIAAMGGRDDT